MPQEKTDSVTTCQAGICFESGAGWSDLIFSSEFLESFPAWGGFAIFFLLFEMLIRYQFRFLHIVDILYVSLGALDYG